MSRLFLFVMIVCVSSTLPGLAQSPPAGAPTTPELEKRVQQLEAQLADAVLRIAKMEEEVARLKKLRPAREKESEVKKSLFPVGTEFEGELVTIGNGAGKNKVQAQVTREDGRSFTLRITNESGSVWEWTCAVQGNRFEVSGYQRVRAADGIRTPAGTADIKARGSIASGAAGLTLTFDWNRGRGHGGMLQGTYTLRVKESER